MASNGNYSYEDMMRMQKDAIRRVKEMQRASSQNMHGDRRGRPQHSQASSQRQDGQTQNSHTQARETQREVRHETAKPPEMETKNTSGQHNHSSNEGQTAKKDAPPDEEPVFEGSTFLKGILERFGLDNEKAMLLVMILMLLNDGADKKLILALAYLLL